MAEHSAHSNELVMREDNFDTTEYLPELIAFSLPWPYGHT